MPDLNPDINLGRIEVGNEHSTLLVNLLQAKYPRQENTTASCDHYLENGILKVDDSCKGTLEWNLPKQIWQITLYKSTISGQISSRSFVTPIFAGADLGSASATVPEMFPTPRAGQSMKIFVLIKKGSGLTDARLLIRSCEYLQWTFHCFHGMLLRQCVSNRFFNTSSLSPLQSYVFLHRSGGSITITRKTFFPGRSSRMWISTTKGVWLPGVLEQAQCFGIFFLFHKISPKDMQMLHPSLMQCRWEKFWEESNIDGFQHCYPAWGTKTMLRLQGLCKISLLHIVISMNVVLCFDYLATGCVVSELPLEIHRLPFSNS